VFVVERLVVNVGLGVGLAAQIVLGQRRALVGTFGFLTDEDEVSVESLLAQGLGIRTLVSRDGEFLPATG
jgi:hypothetical protein